ncbi:MAG TPA: gamma-glutamyl-gamma-aminobutyrate hydrolase family protein [Lachnospiraceae bacterium]|nr:gamma-glutamyl-gamma-aminobutyrate hydrolase family protein [Lachnospiraceae bacterium]
MPHFLIAGEKKNTHNYTNALVAQGATSDSGLYDLWGCYDGLILPGGGDIDPSFFHQTDEGSLSVNNELDQLQFDLLGYFLARHKPVLGICKGIQIINVYFGGTILQDLPSKELHQSQGQDKYHMTSIEKNTFLEDLYGTSIITNSSHHQGLGLLGNELTSIENTNDHVIEAITHKSLPVFGVQWHPERMLTHSSNVYIADGNKIFTYLISLCEK